jgi:hypothetical protein
VDPIWNDVIMFLALLVLVAALATAPLGADKPPDEEPSKPSEDG